MKRGEFGRIMREPRGRLRLNYEKAKELSSKLQLQNKPPGKLTFIRSVGLTRVSRERTGADGKQQSRRRVGEYETKRSERTGQ